MTEEAPKKLKKLDLFLITAILLSFFGASFYILNIKHSPRTMAGIDQSPLAESTSKFARDLPELVKNMNFEYEEGKIGLNFGKDWFVSKQLFETFCDHFEKVKLSFTAEGMAVSGSKTQMFVETDCKNLEHNTENYVLWMPVKQMKSRSPASETVQFNDNQLKVSYNNVFLVWPEVWVLNKVEMIHSKDPMMSFEITSGDLSTENFSLKW